MKWNKLGQLFTLHDHQLAEPYVGFAQSPQALLLEDRVRIYFSTRKSGRNNNYISNVQFVDFDKDFNKVLATSHNEVIPVGKLGTFDEHGIFPFNVLSHRDKIYAFTTGWSRRKAVSIETGIGLAFSNDNGLTFQKYGEGPILTASLHEPFLVCDAFVRIFSNSFHMFYIHGTHWNIYEHGGAPERTYIIAHATSTDGINWTKTGGRLITGGRNECQALPTVICIDGRYHMYFCHRHSYDFRNNPNNAYRLGYAYSDDLKNWTRDDALGLSGIEATFSDWDSDMMCYPHLFRCEGKIYLLYNGNEFGREGFGVAILEQS